MVDHDRTEHDLVEALNDCLERIDTGATIDECVADYPAYSKRLRDLLEVADLVQHVDYPPIEVTTAQQRGRARLDDLLHDVRKNKVEDSPSRVRFGVWLVGAASLTFIVAMSGLIAFMFYTRPNAPTDIGLTVTPLVALNQTVVGQLHATETDVARNRLASTNIPDEVLPPAASATPKPGADDGVLMRPTLTLPASATPMPESGGGVADDVVPTSVSRMEAVSATPMEAAMVRTGGPSPFASATPTAPGTEPMTALPTGSLAPSRTPTPLATPPAPGSEPLTMLPPSSMPPPTRTPTPAVSETTPPPPSSTANPVQLTQMAGDNAANQQQQTTETPLPELPELLPLNAGEIDDNARWDTYLTYRQNFLSRYPSFPHPVEVMGRQIITVSDNEGFPVLGARVRIFGADQLITETRTDARGRALFFPAIDDTSAALDNFRVVVDKDDAVAEFTINLVDGSTWATTLDTAQDRETVALDVLFLLDSTGSMSDEIHELQSNIRAISAQIDTLPGDIDTRYGLVTYRDRGDDYVTRIADFFPDVEAFQERLSQVRAEGGGDDPESLNEALHNAIHDVSWRGDNTVKLIFLVADAPPHLDYPNDYSYADEMQIAAERGIKVHPIASSGLDQVGEFIFRQIAQYTQGNFIFLTYEDTDPQTPGVEPGVPGDERPDLSVGSPEQSYTVEQLDLLVLRLIEDELAALRQQVEAQGR